ncbi:MAG: DUF2281 domain-containing protein [Oscillospiraceae bacterium]|nr:DUF2281 domain-containing protein [Oscillospiraceae bacterium]
MYAVKAIYDGANFKFMGSIPVKEECEVVITFLEPTKKDILTNERERMFGCLRGEYRISSDFDAPLDDFREYME